MAVEKLDDEHFTRHGLGFYRELVNLLLQDIGPESKQSLHSFLIRIATTFNQSV